MFVKETFHLNRLVKLCSVFLSMAYLEDDQMRLTLVVDHAQVKGSLGILLQFRVGLGLYSKLRCYDAQHNR